MTLSNKNPLSIFCNNEQNQIQTLSFNQPINLEGKEKEKAINAYHKSRNQRDWNRKMRIRNEFTKRKRQSVKKFEVQRVSQTLQKTEDEDLEFPFLFKSLFRLHAAMYLLVSVDQIKTPNFHSAHTI